ncbi:hypothetical protein N7478_012352 [Penicillium angulare]|uniref:uncharacterized protein n=1 Tax=Penicillium angulare TaxID=116970 RepID=UPI0025406CDB|nr:uncharacterized protein N7478_012352 [Penicillium angulare]KAJ5259371.1 hypothetical protein N7478_012352 [Penicillium angulare]
MATFLPREYEYNSSGSSTRHSTSDIFGHEMDEELEQLKSRASSRSSISSMPASVLVHPINQMKSMPPMNLHEKMVGYTIEESEASFGDFDDPPRSMRTIRPREAAFRKPSSVRAMQMHTEDECDDDEYLTPPRRRAGMRSPGSSSLKRSPYYSPNASPNKSKVKKEYPLVLLHCNLLEPSLPVSGASEPQNQDIVEEVLPPHYWKRWRRLQDKAGSGVLRDRGVLISHPGDLYDMLEERLLESLELQRPRVHHGHFLGHQEGAPESGDEVSDQGESETDGEQGEECPDCGGRVLHQSDTNRKWEIRVFAANGLMRAGAWAAAWKEMEKVDVEVGLWLPSEVRRALEKRIAEERSPVLKEEAHSSLIEGNNAKEINRQEPSSQERIESFMQAENTQARESPVMTTAATTSSETKRQDPEQQIALGTLMLNYIRVLAGDKRNIALVVMTILVGFLATRFHTQQQLQPIVQYSPLHAEQPSVTPRVGLSVSSIRVKSVEIQPSAVPDETLDSTSVAPTSTTVPVPAPVSVHSSVVKDVAQTAEFVEPPHETTDPQAMEHSSESADLSLETPIPEVATESEPEAIEEESHNAAEIEVEAGTPSSSEQPTEVPKHIPTEEPDEESADESFGEPIDNISEEPIDELVQAPIDQHLEGPIEDAIDAPIEAPNEEPVQSEPSD